MEIKCLGQGSSGNCWVLCHGNEKLIIDAGIPVKEILRGVDYDLANISGAVVTHCHTDHAKSANDLEKYGLEVFRPYESIGKLQRTFGSFDIKAFSVEHDGTPCYGFLITVDGKKLLYITDFELCKYRFLTSKVNHLIVECNYQEKYLDTGADNARHKVLGHCEYETCKKFILESVLTDALQNVIFTHLGVSTCDGNEIVNDMSETLSGRKIQSVAIGYAMANQTYELGE